jgi:hypothetical protein
VDHLASFLLLFNLVLLGLDPNVVKAKLIASLHDQSRIH